MDLRFNYDHIRQQIDDADFGDLLNDSLLVKDIKRDMHSHIDVILELEKQKKELDRKIYRRRMMLKKLAKKWEV
jgi:hypothetical protein